MRLATTRSCWWIQTPAPAARSAPACARMRPCPSSPEPAEHSAMAVVNSPQAARPHLITRRDGIAGRNGITPAVPDRVLMKGNEAIAEAAVAAGGDAYFGYPITPQAELLEWMARRMPEEGRVFVQAESELAAINMALGASAAGARVLVSSSSP